MAIRKFKINGKIYSVQPSTRRDKKFQVNVDGKLVHFGQPGMRIYPGTKRGDNYCARSSGIKTKGVTSPNYWSRKMWDCKGKKSTKY